MSSLSSRDENHLLHQRVTGYPEDTGEPEPVGNTVGTATLATITIRTAMAGMAETVTTKQEETRTVSGEYFLYLLMLHVLPKGFRKTRSYGFLHPCSKKLISFLQMVLRVKPSKMVRKIKKRPKIICPACKATMEIILTRIPKPSRLKHCFT